MTDPRPPRLRLGVLDWLGWRFSLLDDVGVQQHVDRRTMLLAWWRRDARRDLLRIPRREFRPTATMLVVHPIVFAVVVTAAMRVINGTSWPEVVQLCAIGSVGGMMGGSIYILLAARFRRRSAEYVKLMKARALCPACIYSLEGMETDSEHMVTCPECGAKWRFGADSAGSEERSTD